MAEKISKTYYVSAKSRNVALLLSVLGLIGFAGLHRVYVGKILSGCLYFCTLGFLGLGTIYDIIKICVEDFEDADGFPLYADSSMKSNYKRRNLQSPPGIIKIIGSMCASLILFSMIFSFTLVKIYNSGKYSHEGASTENSQSAKSLKSFSEHIRECESQVTKGEMDIFLSDAKKRALSESDIKEICATLRALNIDFLSLEKLDLDKMKRKDWIPYPGGPIYAYMGVPHGYEIAFKIPNIENLDSTEKRYLIIHLEDENKKIRSVSVRRYFDPMDKGYDKFVYYLCERPKKGEDKGILKKVGDYSKTFISKEAISIMKSKIKFDAENNRGKDIAIGEVEYHFSNVQFKDTDYAKEKGITYDLYVTIDASCTMPSQTYGVSEERMYKTFEFSTDGQIKDSPSWSRTKNKK